MKQELPPLTALTVDELAVIRKRYPGIPEDYIQILTSLGWGKMPRGPMIYSRPLRPNAVFGEQGGQTLLGTLLIADDFAGTVFGFDTTNGWCIVAIDRSSLHVRRMADRFTDFFFSYYDKPAQPEH